jgi:hypothetical protein
LLEKEDYYTYVKKNFGSGTCFFFLLHHSRKSIPIFYCKTFNDMKSKILSVLLVVMLYNLAGATDTLTISKTTKPPKLDGVIDINDPWSVDWIMMTQNFDANTTSDITGKFQLTYDENNLFLAAMCFGDKQIDTTSAEIPNSYENDCMEVRFRMDTAYVEGSNYTPGDHVYRMRRGSIFPDRFDEGYWNWGYVPFNLKNTEFKIAQKDEDTAYIQEWQIPWAVLTDSSNMDPQWDGKEFKFDLCIIDNTTGAGSGRTQELHWSPWPVESSHSLNDIGLIRLLSTPVKTGRIKEISVFPNPLMNKLQFTGDIPVGSIIDIYNIEGKKVMTFSLPASKTVNINMFRAGVYLVKIFDGKVIYSGKFIKR